MWGSNLEAVPGGRFWGRLPLQRPRVGGRPQLARGAVGHAEPGAGLGAAHRSGAAAEPVREAAEFRFRFCQKSC